MNSSAVYVQVAVATPLRRCFDYLPPVGISIKKCQAGMRVKIPFGRREIVGIIVSQSTNTDLEPGKLKSITAVIDTEPVIDTGMLALLVWASQYYQHPIGEVIHTALPVLLRGGGAAQATATKQWRLLADKLTDGINLQRAPRQRQLLEMFQQYGGILNEAQLKTIPQARSTLKRLLEKSLLEEQTVAVCVAPASTQVQAGPQLNTEQNHAVTTISASLGCYSAWLLDGVTGSGKTEVYLRLIENILAAQKQVLLLLPEIGLTPQMVQRFTQRLPTSIVVLHSALTDRERLNAWCAARSGEARVVIGTRSAVFTPFCRLGMIIIDEEHDASFKQQDGFRYSARDLAVLRARNADIPIVLGSATPSLDSLYNVRQKRYQYLSLSQRAGGAQAPQLHLLNVRAQVMPDGIAPGLHQLIQTHLNQQKQVLLFLNRRGYAPTCMCHECGWIAKCQRCDSHMTYHQGDRRLRCHHCGADRVRDKNCPECSSEQLLSIGVGTERLEQSLCERYPDVEVIRIDRDTTRRKGSMEKLLARIHDGQRQILIGTQMLAKGHHFPNVTLVGIIDADQGLYSADFRAAERMAQQILQVAGRAGRAEHPGEVYIQTHHPEHPLLLRLINAGYGAFAEELLTEREQAQLPPYQAMAIFRAEALDRESPLQYLRQVAQLLQPYTNDELLVFGPLPAPMEKRAGRYRAQLILLAAQRAALQSLLRHTILRIENIKAGRRVRWSIDVDPFESY